MKMLIAPLIASGCLIAGNTQAALVINDASFDGGLTDLGQDTITQGDSADFDKWVYWDDGNGKVWDMPATGGNPGGYADGAFAGNNYNRTMFQAVTDSKSTTGLQALTFDLNLSDGGANNGPLTVSVWGVETRGSNFSLSARAQAGVTAGNAVILGTQQFSTDTVGWEGQSITDIDFGTGYDLVIIGFWSAQHDQNDPDIVGIDNVAVVPEPGSLALLGLGGLCVLRRRRDH